MRYSGITYVFGCVIVLAIPILSFWMHWLMAFIGFAMSFWIFNSLFALFVYSQEMNDANYFYLKWLIDQTCPINIISVFIVTINLILVLVFGPLGYALYHGMKDVIDVCLNYWVISFVVTVVYVILWMLNFLQENIRSGSSIDEPLLVADSTLV